MHTTQEQTDVIFTSIGDFYFQGIGGNNNYEEAFRFFSKAASMGNVLALHKLGECYQLGLGVGKDISKAFSYYEDACQQGCSASAIALGDLYWNGVVSFMQKDQEKAAQYYFSAMEMIETNDDQWYIPDGLLRIADLFYYGICVEQNIEVALEYYRNALVGFIEKINAGDENAYPFYLRCEEGETNCFNKLHIQPTVPTIFNA